MTISQDYQTQERIQRGLVYEQMLRDESFEESIFFQARFNSDKAEWLDGAIELPLGMPELSRAIKAKRIEFIARLAEVDSWREIKIN